MKNKTKMTRLTALCFVLILMLSALAGCGKTEDSKADTETTVATEAESQTEPKTESKTETQTKADSDAADDDGLYFIQQAVRKSPEWVTKLEAAKDAEQLIVVAGIGKTTAVITMHEKNSYGEWEQIISTPGFIGEDGLGDANINDCYTLSGPSRSIRHSAWLTIPAVRWNISRWMRTIIGQAILVKANTSTSWSISRTFPISIPRTANESPITRAPISMC